MVDYASFNVGGTTYPLTTSLSNSLLQDADPGVFYALSFFSSVINTHIGPRVAAELANAPAMTNAMPSALKYVVPYDPSPWLLETQDQFPLLAVYRAASEYEDHTVTWPHRIGKWKVQYILPPLTSGQMERVAPVLKAVGDVLQNRIENMMDPAYNSGAKVWALAGVESIKLVGDVHGRYENAGTLTFPCVTFDLVVKEIVRPASGSPFQAFTGIDTAIDAASPVAPTLNDLVDVKTDFLDPTTIANLAHYFRGDTGVGFSSTSNWLVSAWTDTSVNVNTAVQATSANEPQFTPAVFVVQGVQRGAVRFNLLDPDYLVAPATQLAVDTGKTYFILARALNTTARQVLLAHTLAADTGAHSITIEANTTGGAGGRFGLQLGGSNYDSQIAVDQGWHIHTLRVSTTANAASIASSLTYRIDGAPQAMNRVVGTGNWQGMATANQLALGSLPALSSTTSASADESLVITFASALSDSTITQVENMMRAYMGAAR